MTKPSKEILILMANVRAENIKRVKLIILELEGNLDTFEEIQCRSFETMVGECPHRRSVANYLCKHINTYNYVCTFEDCPLLDLDEEEKDGS